MKKTKTQQLSSVQHLSHFFVEQRDLFSPMIGWNQSDVSQLVI